MLGCLACILVPVPVYFYYRGGRIREKSKFAPTFGPPMPPNDSGDEESGSLNDKGKAEV